MGFLDDGRTNARFDAFPASSACRRTGLLHAGVVLDDAIVRIRTFVIETRIQASADRTAIHVLFQAVGTMNVALRDDRAWSWFADADAFLVSIEAIGISFASSVDEWIAITMQRVEIP